MTERDVKIVVAEGPSGRKGLLRFVFSTIPRNQGWYFGAPPNRSISLNGITRELVVYAACVFALISATAMILIDRFATDEIPVELYENMRPGLAFVVTALLLGTGLALFWRRAAPTLRPVLAVAITGLIAWQGVAYTYNELSPATSSYHLVRRMLAAEGPLRQDVPFFSIRTYEQTLPFYLKRTMTLVDFYDELALGLEQEPERGIGYMPEFYPVWEALDAGYAAMKPEDFEALKKVGLPMRVLASDTRRVIVSRK